MNDVFGRIGDHVANTMFGRQGKGGDPSAFTVEQGLGEIWANIDRGDPDPAPYQRELSTWMDYQNQAIRGRDRIETLQTAVSAARRAGRDV